MGWGIDTGFGSGEPVVTRAEGVGGIVRLGKESGSCVARMPTHAVRLHEWGTQTWGYLCMGHPPGTSRVVAYAKRVYTLR